jgi:zinc transporter ZupT
MSIFPVLLTVVIAFIATVLGGALAIKYRRRIGVLAAFSAGVLIALALFELLPEIMTIALQVNASLESAVIIMAAGFMLLYVIDRHLFQPRKIDRNPKQNSHVKLGWLATSEFCSHAFIEGMAIGFGFQFNWQLGIVIAVAVISHDFCDGLTTVTLMLSSGNSVKSSLLMLVVDATAPFLGALVTLFFSLEYFYVLFFLSFITGAFLYMGAGNLLPLAGAKNPKYFTLISLVAGFLFILVLARMISI